MFSTSSPTYPASVKVVASAMVKGTFKILARVWARQGFPRPRRADQKDIAFLQFDPFQIDFVIEPLGSGCERPRKGFFWPFPVRSHTHPKCLDIGRLGNLLSEMGLLFFIFFGDNLIAQSDAFITDIDRWSGNQVFLLHPDSFRKRNITSRFLSLCRLLFCSFIGYLRIN